MTVSAEMVALLIPAFVAGPIIALTHVPLGQEVLKRGIIFIDLAIALIAAFGMVVARSVFSSENELLAVILALCFALLAGVIFMSMEKRSGQYLEALIGSSFVITASLTILLLSQDPHGGEYMQDMLAGQLLWVSWPQLLLTALVYAILLFFWHRYRDNKPQVFYIIFPVVVTLSVQLIGVYLVFASLIIPALATISFRQQTRIVAGIILSVVTFFLGLLISTVYDTPSGPTIVGLYPITAFIFWRFSKK